MKIVFLNSIGLKKDYLLDKARNILGNEHELVCYDQVSYDPEVLAQRGKDAEIMIIDSIKVGSSVLQECPNLKMISVAFTGVDHVDLDYCKEHNITVSNAAGYSTVAVADYTMATAVNVFRKIVDSAILCKETRHKLHVGYELEGLTFGIVGLGPIGQRVAKLANAYGCNVIAYNRSKKDIPDVKQVELEYLLKNADVVSLHIPLNYETRNFISKDEINLMKPTSILINTARGPIVDSKALADALKEGKIAGAGIDVFTKEPPTVESEPLMSAPNTVLTGHIAFASIQSFEKRADIVINNIKAWLDGTPQNVVSK
ncbi:MAG: NAD(P)-dependent oxidoreductase [Eubacteriales bacterium]|nr:NAD(P)-dependent oxidoreductase [Eubacteriales bacterium]MDY3332172.1 NAD(P)-dependent oxidoreductase [Gallibacter sp.]